ncbi:DUF2000 domain-containing protein [Carnobacterium maltaromaticum]|uniref:DUF2000 domain-containing protein n=1 Tax=Carnobacterium maltaromaticum TaxID=2751 RepID=UPI0039BDFBE2
MENKKCVLLIDETLPIGLIANTATVLGVSLGKELPSVVGVDTLDAVGEKHAEITALPFPILKSTSEDIKKIRQKATEMSPNLLIIDFTDVAQTALHYQDYIEKSKKTSTDDFNYLGLALYGDKKQINKLTGSLGLLR